MITIMLLIGASAQANDAWQVLSRDLPSSVQKLSDQTSKPAQVEKILGKPKRIVKDGDVEQWHYNITGMDYDLSLRFDHGKLSFYKFAPVSKYLRQYNFGILLKSLDEKEQKKAKAEFAKPSGQNASVKVDSIHTTLEFRKGEPNSFVSFTRQVKP